MPSSPPNPHRIPIFPLVLDSNAMSHFNDAHDFILNDPHFIEQTIQVGAVNNNITNNSPANEQTGIDILLKASNRDAVHDSSTRDYIPRCQPGTREQQTKDIIYWAIPAAGVDGPLPIFWMKGPAGVGKSTIAQTCAEKLKELGKLGATFFFSANGQDKAIEFIPTIVYQLSTEFPDYRDLIDRRTRRDKTILDRTMATQFNALLVEPSQELEKAGKGIGRRIAVIVDGLDECNSADAQSRIIEVIAAATCDGVTPFCWAFFSRPEPHIEAAFKLAEVARVTCTTLLSISGDANSDIELYLRSSFENIFRRRNVPTDSQRPPDNDIKTLVNHSNGLFIYAATALRVVAQAISIEEALCAVCDVTVSNWAHGSLFAELDAFYMLIMQRIPPEALLIISLLFRKMCGVEAYTGGGPQV